MPVVVAIMRALALDYPHELATWTISAAQMLPLEAVPDADRTKFIENVQTTAPLEETIKPSLVRLYGASRKSRERGTSTLYASWV